VTYIHLLLDSHNVIFANGMETESFHPSNTALDTIDPKDRAGLLALVPGIEVNPHSYGDYARRNLSAPARPRSCATKVRPAARPDAWRGPRR
jgi:hypothetical protein